MSFRNLRPWGLLTHANKRQDSLPSRPLIGFDLDHFFDEVFNLSSVNNMGNSSTGTNLSPIMDLAETDKAYHITLEVPGVDEKDINVDFVDGVLTVSGEKKMEKEEKEKNYHRIESSYGHFKRSVALPSDVDPNKITAEYKQGVLTIDIAKNMGNDTSVKKIKVTSC